MNHLQKFTSQVRGHLAVILVANNAFLIGLWWFAANKQDISNSDMLWLLLLGAVILTAGFSILSTRYLTQPLKTVWRAVLHISPTATAEEQAPNLSQVELGRDMVTSLVGHIYQLASVVDDVEKVAQQEQSSLSHDFVATNLPLPLIILDEHNTVIFANRAMLEYIRQDSDSVIGNNFYSVMDLAFSNDITFDSWLEDAKANKAIATHSWERVKLRLTDVEASDQPQFDLAAYYNKNNPQNFETMLVFFDHTNQYAQDDQAMSFVAVAVHELRTPLTLLRGYIEVFEEELEGKLDPELDSFMKKMAVASQQLSTFVNTILDVSRIDSDQFTVKLHKEDWNTVLQSTINDLRMRAKVRDITLELDVADKIPPVAVDRVAISEVLSNLIDNAIKYSDQSHEIVIKSRVTNDGLVETTVQDNGVGIPESAIPHIFERFYRNQRNRAQIGGTGLGLYLAKAIVSAHGGHIWVNSKEGQGSTFGFTVLPYAHIAGNTKTGDAEPTGIVRNAHGWIRNHSLYRR